MNHALFIRVLFGLIVIFFHMYFQGYFKKFSGGVKSFPDRYIEFFANAFHGDNFFHIEF